MGFRSSQSFVFAGGNEAACFGVVPFEGDCHFGIGDPVVRHVFGVGDGAVVFVPSSVFIAPGVADFPISPFCMGRHQVGVCLPDGDPGQDVDVCSFFYGFLGNGGVAAAYEGVFCTDAGGEMSFRFWFFYEDGDIFDF